MKEMTKLIVLWLNSDFIMLLFILPTYNLRKAIGKITTKTSTVSRLGKLSIKLLSDEKEQ